ncbi:MAG: hypothetical protein JWM41_2319 [Gemmatimonadetes bacterium]|nr:hypothetical protein [Gemmatimonadota bacterium]
MTERRAGWIAGGGLLAIYIATLAPGVTFWDAGEFIAAAHSLGIPHPPGTPLFVVALNAWARLLWFLPFATATNLFSAVSTASAGALTAWSIARASRLPWLGLAAGITAGAMTSVWQNATETEVYAASLVVSIAAIVVADLAGRSGERRWLVLAAYLLALAVPLHLSVLVAAPVVVYLVSDRGEGTWDLAAGAAMLGVAVCVLGVGRLSIGLAVVGLAIVAASAMRFPRVRPLELSAASGIATALAVAGSALLIMLVRARHDPAINQADPSSLQQLAYVVGRRQYDLPGMWPRQAPVWLQLANWFEYADWQFALSFAPTVIPTVWRVLVTIAFAALGVVGARRQWELDRRGWRAYVLLFACGTVGVAAYLNMKAGASFGWGFIPDGARHEARDRDYFFVLGFWAWGVWAGMGAVTVARRVGLPVVAGLVLAALPIALNWSAVNRRSEPEASLPREVALALLDSLPPRTVLFVAGDNDTYPVWYLQQVEGRRRDVTVITMPLLGAQWYGRELARREHLLSGGAQGDMLGLSKQIAGSARASGRPVAVAVTVPAFDRNRIGHDWTVSRFAYLERAPAPTTNNHLNSFTQVVAVDTTANADAAARVALWKGGRTLHGSVDPVHDYFFSVLDCPKLVLQPPSKARLASLDSTCNLR